MKKSKIQLRQSMGNIAKKHHNKFDPDTKRNDGALGFFQRASPPNNKKKKKISSVWGPVPGPKKSKNCKTTCLYCINYISFSYNFDS